MMKMYTTNMGRGTDTGHVVLNVHVYINVCLEFLLQSNGHLPMELFENPLLPHLGHPIWIGCIWKMADVENLWVLQWCYTGR